MAAPKPSEIKLQRLPGNNPLHYAVAEGQLEAVKALVELGADLDERNAFGAAPIHLAISCKQIEVAKYLIDQGCHIDGTDDNSLTPLTLSITKLKETPEIATDLCFYILNSAKGNTIDLDYAGEKRDFTALTLAVEAELVDVAKELVRRHANAGVKTGRSIQFSWILDMNNDPGTQEVIDLIVEKFGKQLQMFWAIKNNNVALIKQLADEININKLFSGGIATLVEQHDLFK